MTTVFSRPFQTSVRSDHIPRLYSAMSSVARKRRGQAQARRTAQCKALAAGLIVLSLTHNSSYLHKQLSQDDGLQTGMADQLLSEEPTTEDQFGRQQYGGKGRLAGHGASLPASWRAAERLLEEVRQLGRRDFGRMLAKNSRMRPAVVAHLQEHWRDTDNVAFAFYTSAEGKSQMEQMDAYLPPLSPIQSGQILSEEMSADCWKGLLEGPDTLDKPFSSSGRSSSTSSGGGGASPAWSGARSISPLPMDLLNVTEGALFEQHVSEGILEFEDPVDAESRLRDQPDAEAFPLRWIEEAEVITPVMQNIFNMSGGADDTMLSLANLQRQNSLMSLDGDALNEPMAPCEPLDVEPDFLEAINNVDVSSDNAFLNILNGPLDLVEVDDIKVEKMEIEHDMPFDFNKQIKQEKSTVATNETYWNQSSSGRAAAEETPWVAEEVVYHNRSSHVAPQRPRFQVEASDSEGDEEFEEMMREEEEEYNASDRRRMLSMRRGESAGAGAGVGMSWEEQQELQRRRTERELQRLGQAGLRQVHPDHLARCPQEEFNSMLSQRGLTSTQSELLRDVRRRGRNKLAASKCRQRKAYRLAGAEAQLERARDRADSLRAAIEARSLQLQGLKQEYQHLYKMAFRRMQWADGASVDPRLYRLQLLPDGRVLVVRRERPSAT